MKPVTSAQGGSLLNTCHIFVKKHIENSSSIDVLFSQLSQPCLKGRRNILTWLQTPRAADLTASQAADLWIVQMGGGEFILVWPHRE